MSINPSSQTIDQELVNRIKDAERNINELAARIFGSSSGGTVDSVFGRTGTVTAQAGDYTTSLVTEGSNLYFTDERAQDAVGAALSDSSTVDLTYNDASGLISAAVIPGGIDHGALSDLTSDDHTQYALLAGRASPQQLAFGTASGASTGYLTSTAHATKGKYFLNSAGTITVDEANLRLGIGTATPTSARLVVAGSVTDDAAIDLVTAITATGAMNINHFRSSITLNADATLQFIRAVGTIIPGVANTSTQYVVNNNVQIGTSSANSNNMSGDIFGQFVRLSTGSGYTGTLTRFLGQYLADANLSGGGALTTQAGMVIQNLSNGTNNSQLVLGATASQVPSGNWALYSRSTRDSTFAGNLRIGSTTAPTKTVDITGTLGVSGVATLAGGLDLNVGSDATGDIYYRNSGGNIARLGVGSNGQVLTLASGLPSWASGVFDINALSEDTAPDFDADFVPSYDSSATTNKKLKLTRFFPQFIGHALDTGDRTTTATTDGTATAIANLTLTKTFVSGAIYRIRAGQESYNSGTNTGYLQIWEGTVGSGTKKAEKAQFHSAGSAFFQQVVEYIGTVTAGSVTINVGIKTSAGTHHLYGTGVPSFLTIERLA